MSTEDPVVRLSEEECWQRLKGPEIGRLVTHVGEVIDIFPINYVIDDRTIVFRTAEGSKLVELTVNDEVLFEVDDHTDADAKYNYVRITPSSLSGRAFARTPESERCGVSDY
ncbi:MAG: hypothetical protein BGN97_10780 [Microbacterium sp. 69-10]|uniref:pyridoxamine 5'-phosphate oxidase family protein n=1 Tax=Microbacterium sp. 69-10 TaxID=1895783 RepID=UPI00095CB51E|nr:pyridoxamine 5'-phosphate oxidase family protein [Microbacterium sp. 69-10]OJU38801.1 MAG: hypothetical protein BGN97_10780 [Microbacterium sp. 69-10]